MAMTSAIFNAADKEAEVALTQLSSCAGCAAKMPQVILATLLKHLPGDFRIAGLLRLQKRRAQTQAKEQAGDDS